MWRNCAIMSTHDALRLQVSLLHYTQIQTQDQMVAMLIKRLAAIHQQAREKLEALLLQERSSMESWMQAMADITRTVPLSCG